MGNGQPKEDYANPRNIASVVRQLRAQSGELDAALLRPCREVELSAFDSRTGTLMDRMTGGNTAAMKAFVLRNRSCRFSMRVVADRAEAGPILKALGFPSYTEDVKGSATVFVKELPAQVPEPVCFHCHDAEVYAWPGVAVRFPRDQWRRAAIRDAVVILVQPRRDPAQPVESHNTPKAEQGRLGF